MAGGRGALRVGLSIVTVLIAACGSSGGAGTSSNSSSSTSSDSGSASAPPTQAASPAASGSTAACSLLTVDDATEALGQPAAVATFSFVPGGPVAPASGADVCEYTASAAPGVRMSLSIYRQNGKATYAQLRPQAVAGGAQPASGLGDEALIGMGPDGTVAVVVLKGDISFLLLVGGRGQSSDVRAAAQKAAAAVAGRL